MTPEPAGGIHDIAVRALSNELFRVFEVEAISPHRNNHEIVAGLLRDAATVIEEQTPGSVIVVGPRFDEATEHDPERWSLTLIFGEVASRRG